MTTPTAPKPVSYFTVKLSKMEMCLEAEVVSIERTARCWIVRTTAMPQYQAFIAFDAFETTGAAFVEGIASLHEEKARRLRNAESFDEATRVYDAEPGDS